MHQITLTVSQKSVLMNHKNQQPFHIMRSKCLQPAVHAHLRRSNHWSIAASSSLHQAFSQVIDVM